MISTPRYWLAGSTRASIDAFAIASYMQHVRVVRNRVVVSILCCHVHRSRLAALEAEWASYKALESSRRSLKDAKKGSQLGPEASCQVTHLTETVNALKAAAATRPTLPIDGSNAKHLLVNGATLESYST